MLVYTIGTHQLLTSSVDELMFTTRPAQKLCDWFVPTSNFNKQIFVRTTPVNNRWTSRRHDIKYVIVLY